MLSVTLSSNAGDILRGGAPISAAAPGNAPSGGATTGAVLQARANAKDALARTTQAIQAVQAMQVAAHQAALIGPNNLGLDPNHTGQALPNVPNGLAIGGLQVAPNVPADLAHPVAGEDPALWQGAKLPIQTTAGGKTQVTVAQTAQQALLNWQTFNVGKNTALNFDQSAGGTDAGQWIAFNKINDPSGRPSQILGSIKAQGQVYVINQNGIIFGGASQVNLHALVASSLPINDNLVNRGLLNNPDSQFLFSSLPLDAGGNGTPAFVPPLPNTPAGKNGDVTVQQGASISSPTTPEHVGGRVALIGPNVINQGTITTPDGQTILAAGLQVGLAAHASSDPSLRGLDTYVGAIADPLSANLPYAGTATNAGLINASHANVMIVGKAVNQLGIIDSTTSVALNGRIDLLANYNAASSGGLPNLPPFLPAAAGYMTLGPGSVTQILPEWSSSDRVIGTQLALPSVVNAQAKVIHMSTNAMLLAPGAGAPRDSAGKLSGKDGNGATLTDGITMNAGIWSLTYPTGLTGTPVDQFVYTGGQIYIESGASIYAAGSTDIAAPISENIVSVQLRGAELANAPLQRFGTFRGQTIQVDVRQSGIYNGQAWAGTPLADASGYIGLIQRSVGELTTGGGTVKLNAGGAVVMQPGSTIDVSGGWTSYQGGVVETSRILSSGHILDISQATPDQVYDGLYTGKFTATHLKYGIQETFTNTLLRGAHYEDGYAFGGNGGSIAITAPSIALDGSLLGNTVSGPRQRTIMPGPSALSLVFQAHDPATLALSSIATYSPTPPSIVFQQGASIKPADPFKLDAAGNPLALRADRRNEVILSPDLLGQDGFGILKIDNSDGNTTVPSGVTLSGPAITYLDSQGVQRGGSISLTGKNIDIEGSVHLPHGSLNFTVYDFSPYAFTTSSGVLKTPPPDLSRGRFTLGATASLKTEGLIVDDRPSSASPLTQPIVTNGGTVSINSYTANLLHGSSIDVSGGVAFSPTGKQTYGSGGGIVIKAGQDTGTFPSLLGGKLVLNASLKGYSGSSAGGSLTIQAPLIQIGGAATKPDTLLLSPSFFNQGGFTAFTLNGLGAATGQLFQSLPAIVIAPGTEIAPAAESWFASTDAAGGNKVVLSPVLQPQGVRTPVSLAFNAPGIDFAEGVTNFFSRTLLTRGDFAMGLGAEIRLDPKGRVAINANTVRLLGSIVVPGGTITIAGGNDSTRLFSEQSQALPTVELGSGSILSAAGTTLLTPDKTGRGYRTGSVLNGGSIKVSGNIVAAVGAILDVSGASGVLDMSPSEAGAIATLNGSAPASAGVDPRRPGSLASGISVLPTYSYGGVNAPLNGSLSGSVVMPVRVNSNGGSITLAGAQELFTGATLIGNAGGSSATGGSLALSSGRFYQDTPANQQTPLDVAVVLSQAAALFHYAGQSAIGSAILDKSGNPFSGRGYFAANDFNGHGFDSLTLQGTVQFSGPVTISANGSVTIQSNPKFGNGIALLADPAVNNSALTLVAPYVALGTLQAPLNPNNPAATNLPFTRGDSSSAFPLPPTYGVGNLTIQASQVIDIGNVSLQNIGKASFNVASGDIRGDGTLDVQGSIAMTAGQVYAPTALNFNIFAYDHGSTPGSVTIAAGSSRQPPLSAGGSLSIYASVINQGGVLRAPLGTINLGWDGSGLAPIDSIAAKAIPVTPTAQLNLLPGSQTSVAGIDPLTGQDLLIPYGINLNGISWIDPTSQDITTIGPPAKSVNISAQNVAFKSGASIDIRGGGDLYAYRFVKGLGGSTDLLASTSSFAVMPGYQAGYAPLAAYSSISDAKSTSNQLAGDPGYVNSTLHVGDQIHLGVSNGLPAGNYTLLPARYALLPGAFLVTPQTGTPVGTVSLPDGSSLVSGYRFGVSQTSQPLTARFEVEPASVIRARAQYDDFTANSFFRQYALAHDSAVQRLPMDSGHLVFAATKTMAIQGTVNSKANGSGRGGVVDISSPVDIVIVGPGTASSPGNTASLVLNTAELNAFEAESLLIGGVRQTSANGTTVTVKTDNLTVDNSGTPLKGQDVILVANKNLTLAPGADIESSGILSGADLLSLGNSAIPGSGDGLLLRVSSDPAAQITRSGVSSSKIPAMIIGLKAKIAGASLTLDSTYATALDPSVQLIANNVFLNSGQISLLLNNQSLNDLKLTTGQPTAGLVLSGLALQTLEAGAKTLSLLSYSSMDVYGAGQVGAFDATGQPSLVNLNLHAAEIRGFNTGDNGKVTFAAQNILLDNAPAGSVPSPVDGSTGIAAGALEFKGGTILLGENQLKIDLYQNVALSASKSVLLKGAGALGIQGDLTFTTPSITGMSAASQTITASGAVAIITPAGGTSVQPPASGFGASLILAGASVTDSSVIVLPSGALTLHATTGDVTIGSQLNVAGTKQSFFDLTKYTDGGQIHLISDKGNVTVAAGSKITVAAQSGGGNAGSLSVSAPVGTFSVADGTLFGQGGQGGLNGAFSLDVGSLPSLKVLNTALDAASFTQSQTIRVRTGDVAVDGFARAHSFSLSSDKGSITIAGTVDARGVTGGTINIEARGSVTLQNGSLLTVVGDYYNDAGKGGAVTLEAGSQTNGSFVAAVINPNGTFSGSGFIDIQTGSTIDLAVNHPLTASDLTLGNTTDNRIDLFTGTLHLRAPRTVAGTDLQINPINGNIHNASDIFVEGYKLYDLTASGGAITSAIETNIKNNGVAFAGSAGSTTASYTAMLNRLFANNAGLKPVSVIEPGAEVINTTGDLTLASDWNLATFRFGPKRAPGDLTLRAAGNLVFNGSLSDGFVIDASPFLYQYVLMAQNPLLPANAQSWSYRLAAGSDLGAADFHNVKPLSLLGTNAGSLLLGKNNGTNISFPGGDDADIATAITGFYQVIRTGAGDIDISTGRDVQLLNHFASIYTVGSQADIMTNFDLPVLFTDTAGVLQLYPAQYSLGGGNVTLAAQGNIVHLTLDNFNNVVEDSVRELPMNWLYRRGYVDATGNFGTSIWGESASMTWWVDFSNFFEGIGALGGGNVSMKAGGDIRNVDAVIPTNARMPGHDTAGNPIAPDLGNLLELGGGDLSVQAANNISGGIYYIERGQATIAAGNSIRTNSTRAPFATNLFSDFQLSYPSSTWLPTTLFLGKGSYSVSARNDVLLGPVLNPFLLPTGIGNSYWYKTYFSTYAPNDAIQVTSLAGNVTLRQDVVDPTAGAGTPVPVLQEWIRHASYYHLSEVTSTAAFYQPWLRLNEIDLEPFSTTLALMPSTLHVTAFSGDINLAGNLTLTPSPQGTIDLTASGSVNGLQVVGGSAGTSVWAAGAINLSDANPSSIPGVVAPYAYQNLVGTDTGNAQGTQTDFLATQIDNSFKETGVTNSVLQTKQALHSAGLLHGNDSVPASLYAVNGSISGLTLFSSKSTDVAAGQDITDIALYIQNNSPTNVSLVSAGRDVTIYDSNSPLRILAALKGNTLSFSSALPLAGDIQISGPGSLEVFAGRNLNLGLAASKADGTGAGIVSIGNARNPYQLFAGADIIAGAGIAIPEGLDNSKFDFTDFIAKFVDGSQGVRYLSELAAMPGTAAVKDAAAFDKLSVEDKDRLALEIYYLVLRDAGRDHNRSGSPGFGSYTAGLAAIKALFPGTFSTGNISLEARDIRTKSGGNISLFAPGGKLSLASSVIGNPLAPPGIVTEDGGNIGIFTNNNVDIGIGRIFTLRGGNEIIWSSVGNIAAGSSSKTVQSAPPTRVLVDPQSSDIKTDLAGLATGGGIGVLATVVGVPPGDVDLIAPVGTIDAGDAGIRVTGNINLAAVTVLNASNIVAGGASTGVPTTVVSAPNLSGLTSASNTAGAGANSAEEAAKQQARSQQVSQQDATSTITVELLDYDGRDGGSASYTAPGETGTFVSAR